MTPNTSLTIRPSGPSDVAAIYAMIHELAVFEKLEHLVNSSEAMLHEGLFGAKPACEAIVGIEGGEVVTFALFFHNFSTFLCRKGLYLEDLYVKQAHRGKGHGRAMLVALAQLAQERGCGRFEWTVLDWNKSAIDLYQGMGAELLSEWCICRVTGSALEKMAAQ